MNVYESINTLDLWAVWWTDHVHTDKNGQLAIFATRMAAREWVKKYGIPGCRIERIFALH
jgi:hypothetical protein